MEEGYLLTTKIGTFHVPLKLKEALKKEIITIQEFAKNEPIVLQSIIYEWFDFKKQDERKSLEEAIHSNQK